jgi:hypothetical protein
MSLQCSNVANETDSVVFTGLRMVVIQDGLTPLFAALRDGATDIARLLAGPVSQLPLFQYSHVIVVFENTCNHRCADPPGPVPFLEATALSPNDVLVRWDGPSSPGMEIGCFELECVVLDADPSTGMPDMSGHNRTIRAPGNSKSITVTGLLSNHTYAVNIRSCNIAGWSKITSASVRLPGKCRKTVRVCHVASS